MHLFKHNKTHQWKFSLKISPVCCELVAIKPQTARQFPINPFHFFKSEVFRLPCSLDTKCLQSMVDILGGIYKINKENNIRIQIVLVYNPSSSVIWYLSTQHPHLPSPQLIFILILCPLIITVLWIRIRNQSVPHHLAGSRSGSASWRRKYIRNGSG